MTEHLRVGMGNVLAGTLTRLEGGRLRFAYDDDYRRSRGPTPLSVSMPAQIRDHDGDVVTPWLWGLLPDSNAVIDRWARRFHTRRTPFSLLGTAIGRDCAGAVHFAPPADTAGELLTTGTVDWLTTGDVEQRLLALKADSTTWLGQDFQGQFSLGGAQAKTALLYQDGQWGIPQGPIPTSHILKPAVTGLG